LTRLHVSILNVVNTDSAAISLLGVLYSSSHSRWTFISAQAEVMCSAGNMVPMGAWWCWVSLGIGDRGSSACATIVGGCATSIWPSLFSFSFQVQNSTVDVLSWITTPTACDLGKCAWLNQIAFSVQLILDL
jgi:hypothetical protein